MNSKDNGSEMRPSYDFSKGVRNDHAEQYARADIVILKPGTDEPWLRRGSERRTYKGISLRNLLSSSKEPLPDPIIINRDALRKHTIKNVAPGALDKSKICRGQRDKAKKPADAV
jgi:hypothetical protein